MWFCAAPLASAALAWGVATVRPLSEVWGLIAAAGVVALLPIASSAIRGRFDVFEPVHLFALSFFVLFVARPAFDVAGQRNLPLWFGYILDPTYKRALLVGIVGAAGFYFGYWTKVGVRMGQRIRLPSGHWERATLRAYMLVVIVVSIGILAVFAGQIGLGAFAALLKARSGASILQSTSGYLYTAPLWLTSLGILILVLSDRWRSTSGLFAFGLIAFSQLLTLGNGDRSWSLPVFGMIAAAWYLRRGRQPSVIAAVLAVAVVFIFGISAARDYRTPSAERQSLLAAAKQPISHPSRAIDQFFRGADTAMVSNLAVELRFVPTDIHFRYGKTYLAAAARPIPRSLWTAKPPAADTDLTKRLFPSLARRGAGFSFSLFGEPYLNFGWPGVFVIAAVFGMLWRALYVWYRRAPRNPTVIALYAVNWPFLVIYMRGGIGVDYQRQLIVLLPLICAIALAEIRVRRHPASTGHSSPGAPLLAVDRR